MADSQKVKLLVEGKIFEAKKEILCEYSDYFRAMFSGSYVEQDQSEIYINIVDSNSMEILLRYMEIGLIDLSEYTLQTIGELAVAANFFQITEIIKQIQYCLETQLSPSNWMEIMIVAENSSYTNLEQACVMFGLLSFESMKPEYIPNINKLFWYLSHPYLDVTSELEIFKLGLQWIIKMDLGADALLLVLGCLDLNRVSSSDFSKMMMLIKDYVNSLAAKVVDCLHYLCSNNIKLSESLLIDQKLDICEKYTERVHNEILNMYKSCCKRKWNYTPVLPMWTTNETNSEPIPHNLYLFNEKSNFEKWLEVAEKNLWGWNIVCWGGTKLVLVCGEHGRGTGAFMKDVKVYDIVKKEWTWHGVQLPSRRHGGVAINGDLLYIIGGVGGFRIILDRAIVYNLKERSYRHIANLPDSIQFPAVCVHENMLYASGQRNIYRYEDSGNREKWVTLLTTDIRVSSMISYGNYIYCTQNYFTQLYRFQPDVDRSLQLVTKFVNPPATVCLGEDRLLFFTRKTCGDCYHLTVEEYRENEDEPKTIWLDKNTEFKINDVAGSCNIISNIPPVKCDTSQYHRQQLMRYTE